MQFSVLLKSKVLLIGDARVLLGMQTGPLTKKKVSFKISFKRVGDLVTLYLFLYIYIETSLLLGRCPKLLLT